jgi:hypothetical protein
MLTEEEERALIAAATAGLEEALGDAFGELLLLIRDGVAPREAVQRVLEPFQGEMAATMAAALSQIVGESIGAVSAVSIQVGAVSLSARLYAESQAVAEAVQGIVTRHLAGFQDSRRLALELFEGYTFRPPGSEPLQFNPSNPQLPRYMREALLTDGTVREDLRRAFARLQVNGLVSQSLRAAYEAVLDAIEGIRDAAGQALLERRLQVAFFERMRYFSTRIARTELHKAYAKREAEMMMADPDLEFVQVRRAPGRATPCICELFTGRDMFGLGPGVYPKAQAPLPGFHPFCMCVVAPRLDLTGRTAKERDENADAYFLSRLGETVAARVMGSQARRDEVLAGSSAESVINSTRDPVHRVQTVGGQR